jgi:hypothetical protein
MAGYDWSRGKSNNAVDAELEGKYPASVIARMLNVPSVVITKHCRSCEWHHTGKMYMETDYYDIDKVQEWLTTENAREAIAEYKTSLEEKAYRNCSIKWTEWIRKSRNRKRGVDLNAHGTVIVRGSWVWFRHDKKLMKKKRGGNWFSITLGEEMQPEAARKELGL